MKYLAIITKAEAMALKAGGAVCGGCAAFLVCVLLAVGLHFAVGVGVAVGVALCVSGLVEKAAHPVVSAPGLAAPKYTTRETRGGS